MPSLGYIQKGPKIIPNEGNNGGGGGGSDFVKVNIDPQTGTLDKTFAEIYDLFRSGKILYFTALYNDPYEDSGLDDTYDYRIVSYTLNEVYKYDNVYRVMFSCSKPASVGTNYGIGVPSSVTFQASNSESYLASYKLSFVDPTSLQVQNEII